MPQPAHAKEDIAHGCCSRHAGHQHPGASKSSPSEAKDPVCGMTVDPRTAAHKAEHDKDMYYFCSAGCRAKFLAAPSRYLLQSAEQAPAAAAPRGTIYTCPMHPGIRREGPGSCPICGMGLEPLLAMPRATANPELADLSRRFRIGLALTLPVFALAMAGDAASVATILPPRLSALVQLVLATPVVLWAGYPFFERGWASIINRSLNMFSLIALGTGAAFLYSLVATLAPRIFPAGFRASDGTVAVYFEAASVITILVLLGQMLELRAREATGGAIAALLELAPKTARLVRAGEEDEEIPLELVHVGDGLRVRPGDAVPVDGVVVEGRSAVDESMVTGEPVPVLKEIGDKLIGGTMNGTGAMVMRTETVGADTMLARIVALVAEAQRSRAPIQRLADKVSGYFVPGVMGAAVAAFAGWAIWGPPPAGAYGLVAAVSVLIIACPCALGLATPMSIMVGVGKGALAGILIKSAEALERMERVDTIVLDKTGTLTEGRPRVVETVASQGFDEAELVRLGAGLERASEHPLAAALLALARDRRLIIPDVAEFAAIAGKGVTGTVAGRNVALGNARLMEDAGIDPGGLAANADAMRRAGATALFVAVDGKPAGVFAIVDPIKATTPTALAGLRAAGLRIVMLTGDSRATASSVARTLGITDVEAEVLPQDKLRIIERLRGEGRTVAMAGDGINDAPALAGADVGIAMGTGAAVAIESAGITLIKGDIQGIASARTLSRATMRNIRQNLALAFLYNLIGVPVAAGILYPVCGLLPGPMIAALAMALSSTSVIANALRLRHVRL